MCRILCDSPSRHYTGDLWYLSHHLIPRKFTQVFRPHTSSTKTSLKPVIKETLQVTVTSVWCLSKLQIFISINWTIRTDVLLRRKHCSSLYLISMFKRKKFVPTFQKLIKKNKTFVLLSNQSWDMWQLCFFKNMLIQA